MSNELIRILKDITHDNEEKRLQKASECSDGISYYNCNALPMVDQLANELSKLSEVELSLALRILVRKTQKKAQKK